MKQKPGVYDMQDVLGLKVNFEGCRICSCATFALYRHWGRISEKSREVIQRAMERFARIIGRAIWQNHRYGKRRRWIARRGRRMFVNAVVGLRPRPGETPESLIGKLQLLWEQEFGRQPKKVLNEARSLDLGFDCVWEGNAEDGGPGAAASDGRMNGGLCCNR